MTGLNGVHALLAFLTQQAQTTKPVQVTKVDLKQLEELLQESRILNERLLKIEKVLSISRQQDPGANRPETESVSNPEGSWPAASVVRDVINSQARQQGFGYGQSEKTSDLDVEPFFYRESYENGKQPDDHVKQLLVQRYTATEQDELFSKAGMNFGSYHWPPEPTAMSEADGGGESGRLALMSIGLSLLLLTLFALVA